MDSLLQANIFFFIASIATVVLAIFAGIALWHLSRVAKNIHRASDVIRDGILSASNHLMDIKEHVSHLVDNLKNNFDSPKRGNKTRSKK